MVRFALKDGARAIPGLFDAASPMLDGSGMGSSCFLSYAPFHRR